MKYACSWSGGKDSALALWRSMRDLGPAAALLTMFTESGERSRAHGLRRHVLDAQAQAAGIPLATGSASWQGYTEVFLARLESLKAEHGIEATVFGDIDLEPHRQWCRQVCDAAGLACLHPLWGESRAALVRECLSVGIEAIIVAVKQDVLPPALLGRTLDEALLAELEAYGVDAAGEQGEYHTVVVAGPMFRQRIRLVQGEQVLRDGCHFLDVEIADRGKRSCV